MVSWLSSHIDYDIMAFIPQLGFQLMVIYHDFHLIVVMIKSLLTSHSDDDIMTFISVVMMISRLSSPPVENKN